MRWEKQVVGVYSKGHLFGDLELKEDEYKKESTVRQTEARTRVDTKVYLIPIFQFLDCTRLFSSLEELDHFIKVEGVRKKEKAREEAREEAREFRIDFQDVQSQFFRSLQRKQQQKEEGGKDESVEVSLKDMFMRKFTFSVPFKQDPLNNLAEIVSTTSHKKRHWQRNGRNKSDLAIYPLADSIINIIHKDDLKKDRRFSKSRSNEKSSAASIHSIFSKPHAKVLHSRPTTPRVSPPSTPPCTSTSRPGNWQPLRTTTRTTR